jgi:hypothetical protein
MKYIDTIKIEPKTKKEFQNILKWAKKELREWESFIKLVEDKIKKLNNLK